LIVYYSPSASRVKSYSRRAWSIARPRVRSDATLAR
jgi:hypothetical protein